MMTTGAQVITTIHLAILAALALLVIAGVVWGARLRQRRRDGAALRAEHQAEVEAAPSINTAPREAQAQSQAQFQTSDPSLAPMDTAHPEAARADPEAAAPPIDTPRPLSPADQPVTVLKGLGPKIAARLNELGYANVGDIAALDEERAAAVDAQLGAFAGRMARDRWIEQARFLAAGDRAGFEAVFGKL